MNTSILVAASALSDQDLLARLEMLASKEREASARPPEHRAKGRLPHRDTTPVG